MRIAAIHQPRYSKEEFAQRGDLIYQTQIRPQVELGNQGKIVAIDLETGDFEIDAREIPACNRLEARSNSHFETILRCFSDLEIR
ncbi:MAG: hypothetical protein GPI96_13830 [Microcystis aeruginosa BS13-02]|nr:hypothetical protein [Microcystis aeruginosa BS13-02]